jgi:hypothetical protein
MNWRWGRKNEETYPMLESLDLTRVSELLAPEMGCTDLVITGLIVNSVTDGVEIELKLKIVGW